MTRALARASPSVAAARFALGALVPLYGAQLLLTLLDSRLQSARSPYAWMKALPLPVFDDRVSHQPSFAAAGLALGLCESLALGTIVLALRNERALGNRVVGFVAGVLALMSLAWPVMSTTDPYEYVATGLLGMQAYTVTPHAFAGTIYEPYQRLVPMRGVIYGPLWVVIDRAQTAFGASILAKLEALRLTNAALVIALLALLRRSGLSRPALVACAANPSLWCYCVVTPHAEIEGLVLLAAAHACARRAKPWPALCFIIAAGLIKLPFVITGGALLAPLHGRRRRVAAWCLALGVVVAVSYLVPGPVYMATVSKFATHRLQGPWYAGWLATATLIAAASIVFVALRRTLFGAAWLFQQMSPLAAPWYLLWGVPFALATGSLEAFAAGLPIAASILDETTRHETGLWTIFALVSAVLLADVSLTANRRRYAAPAPS